MLEQLELDAGCMWITGKTLRGVSGKNPTPVNVFCNKLRAEGSVFCPKHTLFWEDEAQQPERDRKAKALRRETRKQELEFLATSPLRAENPEAGKKVRRTQKDAGSEERVFG